MNDQTKTDQEIAIAAIEAAGFECVSNFFAGNDGDPEDNRRAYIFSKRISRFQTKQCQIDPDGSVNGQPVEAFLDPVGYADENRRYAQEEHATRRAENGWSE